MSEPITVSHGNRVRECSGGRALRWNKRRAGGQESQPVRSSCPWHCQPRIQSHGAPRGKHVAITPCVQMKQSVEPALRAGADKESQPLSELRHCPWLTFRKGCCFTAESSKERSNSFKPVLCQVQLASCCWQMVCSSIKRDLGLGRREKKGSACSEINFGVTSLFYSLYCNIALLKSVF